MDRENNQNTNSFLMFIFSLLPGCAHMYLGLMKRGIQLMLSFLLLIGITVVLNSLSFILVPVLVVMYVYSFFDGYSIFRNIKSGKTVNDEDVISGFDSIRKMFINGYWIGLILLILGTVLVFQNLLNSSFFSPLREIFNIAVKYIPAAILLALGIVLMIKGSKERNKIKEPENNEISE